MELAAGHTDNAQIHQHTEVNFGQALGLSFREFNMLLSPLSPLLCMCWGFRAHLSLHFMRPRTFCIGSVAAAPLADPAPPPLFFGSVFVSMSACLLQPLGMASPSGDD